MAQEAYKYYSDYSNTAANPKVFEQPKVRKKVNTNALTNKRVKSMLTAGIIVASVFLIVFRYTVISEMTRANETLQRQLNEVTAYNDQQTIFLESQTNLKSVEQVAQNQLNMGTPNAYQTVEVEVEMANKAVKVESNKGKFVSSIKKIAGTVMEYLY